MKILRYVIFFLIICLRLTAQDKSEIIRAKAELLFGVDNKKALELYKQAYKLAQEKSNVIQMANLSVDISSVYHQTSEFETALSYCKKGFQLLDQSKVRPDSLLFKLNSSTGTMFKNLFQLDSTIFYYERANLLISANPKLEQVIPEYVLHHYNSYGKWLISFGENKRGLVFLDKARVIAKRYKFKEDVDIINTNIATLYNKVGEFEKAKKYFHEVAQNQKVLSILKCYAMIGEGWVDINSNKIKSGVDITIKAKKYYDLILQTEKSTESFSFISRANYQLAVGYQKLGNKKESLKILDGLIRSFNERGISKDELLCKIYIRIAEQYLDQPQKALTSIHKSQISNLTKNSTYEIFTKKEPKFIINEKLFFESAFLKAKIAFKIYTKTKQKRYLQLSVVSTQQASVSLKKLRENYFDEEAKLFLNTQLKSFYEFTIGLYIFEDSILNNFISNEEIFKFIESHKSSVLNEIVASSKAKASSIPPILMQKEKYLDAQIFKIKSMDGLNKEKSERLLNLEAEKYFLEEKLKSQYPEYLKMKSDYAVLSTQEIQKQLNKDDAYLSYFLSEEKILIFIVLKNSFELKILPYQRSEFDAKSSALKSILFKNPGLDIYKGTTLSTYFYTLLYQPIKNRLAIKKRIIINRDHLINFLPFEILETGEYQNDFLFKKHSVSYVYGNNFPTTTKSNNSKSMVLGIAPFTGDDLPEVKKDLILSQSKKQIENVADNLLVGKNATKQNFLNYLSRSQIIYFATHSVLNDIAPNESHIQFFPNENNLLKVDEIYKLDFANTKLIVLSSCEAGTGKTHFSEGMLSISRAFHVAGCPSVLTTLWSSNDASVTILSTMFNKYLMDGYEKDVALQKARIEFINSKEGKKYNHPYFWANLILVGNRDTLYSRSTNYIQFLIYFVILLEAIRIGLHFKDNQLKKTARSK